MSKDAARIINRIVLNGMRLVLFMICLIIGILLHGLFA